MSIRDPVFTLPRQQASVRFRSRLRGSANLKMKSISPMATLRTPTATAWRMDSSGETACSWATLSDDPERPRLAAVGVPLRDKCRCAIKPSLSLSPLPPRMDTNRRWSKHLGAGLSRWSLCPEAQIGWCSPRRGMATFPRTPVTGDVRLPVESQQVGAATGHAGNTIVNRCEPSDRSSRRSFRQYSERSGPKVCKRSTIRRWSMRQWFLLVALALCGIEEVSICVAGSRPRSRLWGTCRPPAFSRNHRSRQAGFFPCCDNVSTI